MELLFLAHRAPFPPDRGDKIRSHHILRHLARHATVHLAAFADDPRDEIAPPDLRAMLGEVLIVPRTRSRAHALADALLTRRPFSLSAFDDARLHAWVADLLARRPIKAIYAFSGQMAQYLPATRMRTVMDFVDLDSAKFAAYARDARGPMRWLMRREARLLAAYERQVATRVDASLFVSAAEAALLPGAQALENGIDTERYDPAAVAPVATTGPMIVFTGQMDYRPNIDAVVAFARTALPAIVACNPQARFAIVGRAPAPAVRALAGPQVIVTGEVPDTRPWLAAASVVVAPLALARGVQNKVLEAMAMARAVVASPAAAAGIDHAGAIVVSDTPAEAVSALLADPERAASLGAAARAQVIARYGWDARLAGLEALVSPRAAMGKAA
ncbi:TIGR03087 family PEP-CTERM/XrtA system glycosyltransferase [Sphingomonas sp.]|uniref:TIGR03087 family PEP-CTERM/XrtA system glycosyltransferase n=1 Tax=Sphingomonas sp. TaxID=28214 RepID=UPI0035C7D553